MYIDFIDFFDKVDALHLQKIPKRKSEEQEDYLNKVYEEARAIFYGMVEDFENNVSNIENKKSLDKDEEWYDEFYEQVVLDLCTILSIYE